MVNEVKYNTEDIEKLRMIVNAGVGTYDSKRDHLLEMGFNMTDNIDMPRSAYYKDGTFHIKFLERVTPKQPTQYLKSYLRQIDRVFKNNVSYDIYHFLFYVPFEDIPMYSYDVYLNLFGLIQWRLDIGK